MSTPVNTRVSPFAVRAALYSLAVLPSDTVLDERFPDVTTGALYEWNLDHLEVRDRQEAANVRRVVQEAGL